MEKLATISKNGRFLIPARFRKQLKLKPGDKVILRIEGRSLRLITLEDAVYQAQNLVDKHAEPGMSLVDTLIEDRESEASNE